MDHDARKAVPTIYITKRERHTGRSLHLCCRIQHILDKDAVAGGGIIDENMGHRAHQFSILYNRTAGHADVK